VNRLDVQISSFSSVKNTDAPVNVNLLDWLKVDHKDVIQHLRSLSGETYKNKKRSLAGITPSGTFSNRSESGLIEHSGLIQFDIDGKDNTVNMDDLKHKIKHIPYVAYLSYSTSGNGLWGLIPIQHKDRHKAHFRAIQKAFDNAGITVDPAPSNVASFRFISYDPDPYFNNDAEVFTYTIDKKIKRQSGRDNRDKVEELIGKIQMTHTDITNGYDNWLKIGFALSEEFGESGRIYFHQVSQWHSEYDHKECDVQFTNCLKSNRNGISIASFFHLCKVHGIELNKHKSLHECEKDRALQSKFNSNESAPYGFNPYTGEIFDERGYPADWDSINPNYKLN
jgi:hypothetical protein